MSRKELESLHPGLQLILAERQKMIAEHGYTVWFDRNTNKKGELLMAAKCFLQVAFAPLDSCWDASLPSDWPWKPEQFWKAASFQDHEGCIRDMIRAGALLSAEYDRYTNGYAAFTTRAFNDIVTTGTGYDEKELQDFYLKTAISEIDILLHPKKLNKGIDDLRWLRAKAVLDVASAIRSAIAITFHKEQIVFPKDILSPVDAILCNYMEVIRVQKKGWNVSIFRPKNMDVLPVYGMNSVVDYQVFVAGHGVSDGKFYTQLYEYRAWNALALVREYFVQKKIEIFISSILLYPYSKQAHSFYYDKLFSPWPPQRLERIWDSRKFDAQNGYSTEHCSLKGFSYDSIMSRNSSDDLMEGDGL